MKQEVKILIQVCNCLVLMSKYLQTFNAKEQENTFNVEREKFQDVITNIETSMTEMNYEEINALKGQYSSNMNSK